MLIILFSMNHAIANPNVLRLQSRTDLEQHSVEGSSTSDSVSFITFVQSLKRKLKNWEKVMEVGNVTLAINTFINVQ